MDASSSGITINKDGLWQDITNEFKDSVSQLNLGELLQSDHCTLLEAMSAIELMDPRMDSGMVLKKCNRKILNFDQSIKSGQIKINNLEPSELLGIIDETYCCLVSWLDGHHLAQTVMTNLYLHGPEKIEDRCLRVFSSAALKITKFIDSLVCEILCVEEEDFQLNMCKFNLDLQVTDVKVLSSLEDLCQLYEKKLTDIGGNQNSTRAQNNINQSTNNSNNNNSQVNNNPNKKQNNNNKQQMDSPDNTSQARITETIDSNTLSALICRLRFSYHFYACLMQIHRNILKDSQSWADFDNQTDAQISKFIKLVQNAIHLCDQHLEKCLKYLDKWNETIDQGIMPMPVNTDGNTTQEDLKPIVVGQLSHQTVMGFEPLINLKLLPAGYPRCPSIKSRQSTIVYLRDLISRMRHCISISGAFYQKSLIKSLNLIENFSKYFQPSSCVISRSFLQALYLPAMSTKLLKEDLLHSMLEYFEPLGQLMRGIEEAGSVTVTFLDCCAKAFSQVVAIYGHNPSRQHERFWQLIDTFKNLQYESSLVNNMAYSWTTYHLARLCIRYVLSGLDLELFSAHEYPYVFWYLYEILYKNEREQLELARQLMENQLLAEEAERKAKGKKNRNNRKQSKTAFHEKKLSRNDAFRFLTGGTFLLTYGLKLQGKIRTPSETYTSEEICFDHRFGALTGTSVYQSYKLTLNRLEKLEHIYREALDCFSEAKEIFNLLDEHESCLKICKANMVVTRILSTNLEFFKNREVEFNFDTHPSFPTVKFLSE